MFHQSAAIQARAICISVRFSIADEPPLESQWPDGNRPF
jgi:hypothetical protein